MMELNRRQVLLGGAAGGMALGLSGCGSDGEDDGEATGPLQFFLSGDANQGGGYAAMAARYAEETGVEVQIVDIANDDLKTRLINATLADDLPALARVGSIDPTWRDLTVDLRPIMDESGARSDLAAVDLEGKVLSLPSDVTAVGLFLNKTLFDEAGATFPTSADDLWSWDSFVTTVKDVQAGTGASYGMVMDRSSHRLKSFMYQFGSSGFLPHGSGTYQTNDATREALQYFYDLNDDSFMPRSVWLSDGDPNALFKSGDVVAYYSGSWQIADFSANIADFEWVSVRMPTQPVRATNFGNAASVVVFDGPQADAAYDFVSWLYEAVNYTELSEISGFLPAVEGVTVTYADHAEAFELYNEEIAASDPVASTVKAHELALEVEGIAVEGDPIRDETVRYLNDEQDLDTTIQNINDQLTAAAS